MNALADLARRPLALPAVYDLYQRLVGAPDMQRRFVRDHIRARAGQRLLDIGCGTGAVVPFLPEDIELVGVDISPAYIAAARKEHGERGTFIVADASDTSIELGMPFDAAYASGVLHHIPDAPARRLVEGALARVRPGGHFVALDPTLTPGQGLLSRIIVSSDRGKHVRSPDQMARLLDGLGARIEVVTDMLNIPFAQTITTIVKS